MISSLEHREKRDKLLASRNYSIHFAPFFLCKLMKFNRTSSVAFPYFLLFSKAQKWTRGDKCSPILIQGSTSCAGFAKRLGLGCRQQQPVTQPPATWRGGRARIRCCLRRAAAVLCIPELHLVVEKWTRCYFLRQCQCSSFSCVRLCNPWTVTRQAPLSMGFSRLEQWSG